MARLGRSQIPYRPLRRGIEGPPVTFRPLVVLTQVAVRTAREYPRHDRANGYQYIVRKPTVIAAATVFAPVKTYTTDAERPRFMALQRGPWYKLRPPTIIGPAATDFMPAPVVVKLTEASRKGRVTHSRLRAPTVVTVTYTDSGSGTITLSGSGSESHSHTAAVSGTLTLSGLSTESAAFADSPSGTITLSGTFTQSHSHTSASAGTITLSGTASENYVPPGFVYSFVGGNFYLILRNFLMRQGE